MSNPLKNVMNMFTTGGQQVAPQAAPQPAPQSAPQPSQPAPNDPSPHQNVNPTADPRPQEPAEPESPLAGLAKLWEANPDDGKNAPKGNPFDEPIFQFDDAKFGERVNSMNFVDQAALETVQERLIQGDTTALAELINAAARSAYTQATKTSAAAAEHAAKIAMQRSGSQVPELLTTELTRQELATQNKLFTDPALKPVAESIAQQYRNKYPDASPQDIAKYTQHYFQQITSSMAPQQQPQHAAPQEQSFEAFWGA